MGRRSRRRPKKLRCFSSVRFVALDRIFMTPITSPKPPYLGSIPHLTHSLYETGTSRSRTFAFLRAKSLKQDGGMAADACKEA